MADGLRQLVRCFSRAGLGIVKGRIPLRSACVGKEEGRLLAGAPTWGAYYDTPPRSALCNVTQGSGSLERVRKEAVFMI